MDDLRLSENPKNEILRPDTVKKMARDYLNIPNLKVSQVATELLSQATTEFIQLISLSALDESKQQQYVDSDGVIKALKKLGFDDVAAELPSLHFSEDMFYSTD